MPRKRKTLHVLTLFVAGALAADTLGGCVAESDPGPSLNPQPLPPSPPPDEEPGESTDRPATGGQADGTSSGSGGASSSGSAGSSGSSGAPEPVPDAGGN